MGVGGLTKWEGMVAAAQRLFLYCKVYLFFLWAMLLFLSSMALLESFIDCDGKTRSTT
jgi:hypothetical protein